MNTSATEPVPGTGQHCRARAGWLCAALAAIAIPAPRPATSTPPAAPPVNRPAFAPIRASAFACVSRLAGTICGIIDVTADRQGHRGDRTVRRAQPHEQWDRREASQDARHDDRLRCGGREFRTLQDD